MEHKNPLLHETVSQKFITFGEIWRLQILGLTAHSLR